MIIALLCIGIACGLYTIRSDRCQHIYHTVKDLTRQKIRNTITSITHNGLLTNKSKSWNLEYYDGTRKFIVCIPKGRSTIKFNEVRDENGLDVTHNIIEYMGINRNFHNIPTTPSLLGYKQLRFEYTNGDIKIFELNDIIN